MQPEAVQVGRLGPGPARGPGSLHDRARLPGDPILDRTGSARRRRQGRPGTWRASRPNDWANESLAISISPEAQYCVGPETGCWYAAATQRLEQGEPEKTVVIDRSLIEINLPTLRDRLAKARVRLGGLLNQVVGKVSAPRRRLLGPLPAQPLGHAYGLRRYRR